MLVHITKKEEKTLLNSAQKQKKKNILTHLGDCS